MISLSLKGLVAAALAQVTPPASGAASDPPPSPPSAPAALCTVCIPKLTDVDLVIDADMGSKTSTTGATFPLHLAEPITIDGRVVVPEGTTGQGEVIHAKKAGGAGAAGELVLAARFLAHNGRRIRLRSLRIAVAGKDSIGTVDAVNAAAAGAAVVIPAPIALIGFAITGKNIVLPAGTRARARTAEEFPLNPPTDDAAVQGGTGLNNGGKLQ